MALSIANIDHIVLKVRDMERAISFYRDVLGCQVEREVESIGLVQMRAGVCMIDLVPREENEPANDLDHFCVRIADWNEAAVLSELKSHGIDAPDPVSRYGAEGDGPSIYVNDPDGNVVELKGPPFA
jgi:glyoxylase I family protein